MATKRKVYFNGWLKTSGNKLSFEVVLQEDEFPTQKDCDDTLERMREVVKVSQRDNRSASLTLYQYKVDVQSFAVVSLRLGY